MYIAKRWRNILYFLIITKYLCTYTLIFLFLKCISSSRNFAVAYTFVLTSSQTQEIYLSYAYTVSQKSCILYYLLFTNYLEHLEYISDKTIDRYQVNLIFNEGI